MDDYSRVARIIRYLDENRISQPSLAELASVAGLSESHLHRLFKRWAGVTPKDFLQCLTAEHAKERLRNSESVFDTAIDVGLSGPGRLHDLLVTLEAVSPGEFKERGRGLVVSWGWAESPLGIVSLAWTERGICHLAFHEEEGDSLPESLAQEWANAEMLRNDKETKFLVEKIFSRKATSLKALVRGTAFQVKVWRALLSIPEGSLVSYGQLAGAVGSPGAARAVGSACGNNAIGFLIPCHRVIRETGIVTGYRWGDVRKRALIAREMVGPKT
ncbi:MAG: 6-O-methylguanine DNA methyltransferase [Verrucomicrobiales bacterium]|nr:6-O-methylguanine DNA methyltransferase [Verrucomicrobiales bacterium]